jgi:hypothetical protein
MRQAPRSRRTRGAEPDPLAVAAGYREHGSLFPVIEGEGEGQPGSGAAPPDTKPRYLRRPANWALIACGGGGFVGLLAASRYVADGADDLQLGAILWLLAFGAIDCLRDWRSRNRRRR